MSSPLLAAALARTWPPLPPHLIPAFWLSFLLTPLIYSLGALRYPERRKRAWIATATASGCMTLCALPFFLDWAGSWGSLAAVRERKWLAENVCAAFVGYLISDLITGLIFYSEHVSLLMGWIHHTLYVLLVSYVISQGWSHIFALAAIMELPTHHLAIATLEPWLRNDYVFAGLFFLLRVAFHILLIAQFCLPSVRIGVMGGKPGLGQWGPAVFLSLALPMHVIWFHGCVKGILRRQKKKREAAKAALVAQPSSEEAVSTEPVPVGTQTPGAEKLLAFSPSAARAIGLPTPGLTPHTSPALRPLSSPPSSSGTGAGGQLTPPITPPQPSDAYTAGLSRAPSLLSLPNLYLPSREEVRRRLGREGRREAVRSLRDAGRGVVMRVTGYATAGAGSGGGYLGRGEGVGSGAEQAEREREGATEGVEESERRRSEIAVY
ncbi:hypothetical protein CALVIDRAFT_565703 [Calocera viscosa TUFC12733]|uniref:TLC domain-containing protein n=1 Tax=Calocera viscosa (strain TUFC12733) TaxID=1330018 RepID=A0A167K794_CALVF|nr:hypothetical protein CALVIDRAFT_565703 [Calocera viscosa TUFC12733]